MTEPDERGYAPGPLAQIGRDLYALGFQYRWDWSVREALPLEWFGGVYVFVKAQDLPIHFTADTVGTLDEFAAALRTGIRRVFPALPERASDAE